MGKFIVSRFYVTTPVLISQNMIWNSSFLYQLKNIVFPHLCWEVGKTILCVLFGIRPALDLRHSARCDKTIKL